MRLTVAQHISGFLTAIHNCEKRVNPNNSSDDKELAKHWIKRHTDSILEICKEHMPSGSGFDNGTHLDFDSSTPQKLVFYTAYHHMNDGVYSGWTTHRVIVKPEFNGFHLSIGGNNTNDIKDHIADCFNHCLEKEIDV